MKEVEDIGVIGVLEDHGAMELAMALRGAAERGIKSHEFTFRGEQGEIFAVGGAIEILSGVHEIWLKILDYENVRRLRKTFLIACQNALDEYATDVDARRLQCTAEARDTRSNTFLVALGFIPEGFMLSYGKGGVDHIRYARIYQ